MSLILMNSKKMIFPKQLVKYVAVKFLSITCTHYLVIITSERSVIPEFADLLYTSTVWPA